MKNTNTDNIKRAKKIKLLLTDVDGVLTDGRMFFFGGPKGEIVETKGFYAPDGIGLWLMRSCGIKTGMITGRNSDTARIRAKALGMNYAYLGFLGKLQPFNEILAKSGFTAEETCYIGDDLIDLSVMRRAGLACAPKNACAEVRKMSHIITDETGGYGAVRAVCEFILKAQGKWDKALKIIDAKTPKAYMPEKMVVVTAKE